MNEKLHEYSRYAKWMCGDVHFKYVLCCVFKKFFFNSLGKAHDMTPIPTATRTPGVAAESYGRIVM